MKWFNFLNKKPRYNKPFLFFNRYGRLQSGIYERWSDCENGNYNLFDWDGIRVVATPQDVELQEMIQYWCYFSKNGLGTLYIPTIGHVDNVSNDQSAPTEEELRERRFGCKWQERYNKMASKPEGKDGNQKT